MSFKTGRGSTSPYMRTRPRTIEPKRSLRRDAAASDVPKHRRTVRIWARITIALLLLVAIGAGVVMGVLANWMSESPPLDVASLRTNPSTVILDTNGKFYQELDAKEKRVPVTIEQIPEMVQLCFVSIEDQRFYSHQGIDIRGTAKAVIGVLTSGQTDGPGGSTLTQQLIKMTHLTSDKMVTRKAQEWKLAYQLEKKLSKRRIIENYLNQSNMSQTWGIESAANFFFGKTTKELSLAQAAVLTSIVNLPTKYNPYTFETDEEGNRSIERIRDELGNEVKINLNPENMKRSRVVVDKMLELGHITKREHDIAVAELEGNNISLQVPASLDVYTYFTDECYRQVIRDLAKLLGMSVEDASGYLLNGGYTIVSTIDIDIQAALDNQAAIDANFPAQTSEAKKASALVSAAREARGEDPIEFIPQVAGAIIENETGYVVGILGGRGEKVNLGLNRASTSLLPLGSTTKPITVYAPGFDRGSLTLASAFDNNKLEFPGGYKPNNYPNTYTGMTTVREGIRSSINVVALLALNKVGIETSVEYAERFGFTLVHPDPENTNKNHDHAMSPLALGSYTNGQTMVALASAYTTFPNGGVRIEPYFYKEVLDSNGNVVLSALGNRINVISEQAAWITTTALKDVVRGGTTTLSIAGQEIAGKTGTTSDNINVLFSGFTEKYSGAFWFGYDVQYYNDANNRRQPLRINTSSGREKSPARFWQAVFKEFYEAKGLDGGTLPAMPSGISSRAVDKVSGKAPTELSYADPRGSFVSAEYFIDGTYPAESDDIHEYAMVCAYSGMSAGSGCPSSYRVVLNKDPDKIYPPGVKLREPDFTPEPEEGYVMQGSTPCTMHSYGGYDNWRGSAGDILDLAGNAVESVRDTVAEIAQAVRSLLSR
ncbi:MAG: transglycosylase domain-containing protein [Eubacteriaceae bacterium]|nr:transglycosylase domain-containing protein [Eubacteriaceae bacterium]